MTALRNTLRSLFKAPAFTSVAIVTIAIAIGASTTLFSVFDALVLHPIDLPDASRLVRIWTNKKERNLLEPVMSVPKYDLFQRQQSSFDGIAASSFGSAVLARDGADPEQIRSLIVTASFVPTVGLRLARGRNFNAEEDTKNGPHVCLLSFELWKTRFGMRESVVGEQIELNGVGTTVVGVLAPGLPAPLGGVQLFEPWPFSPAYLTQQQLEGGAGFLQITARLKPGVTFAAADADVRALGTHYQREYPGRLDGKDENELRTWTEEQVGPVRPTLTLLLGAVGLVLFIACANVSNLFLGRLTSRQKEIAVRLSLGATRTDLVRQFLFESAVFCLLAGSFGVMLAAISLRTVERVFADQFQNSVTFSLNAPTLAFSVGIAALSSITVGLVPAIQATRLNLSGVLKDNGRGTAGGAHSTRLRGVLVVAEVSLSVLLLVGSALLLGSFLKLQDARPGFSSAGVASVIVSPSTVRYPDRTSQVNFYLQVIEKLKSYPHVTSAASTAGMPLANNVGRYVFAVFGRPIPPLPQRPIAYNFVVSEDFFSVLGIPLRKGRGLLSTDIDNAPMVCVINESFARRIFPNEDPVGRFLVVGQAANTKLEVVGVVGDVKSLGLGAPTPDIVYRPLRQVGATTQTIVAATSGDPNTLEPLLRAAVSSVDRSQAISGFASMDNQIQRSLGVQRLTAWLTGAFAAVALLLSALGLYTVLAYTVSQRRTEIGIRVALGASSGRVVGLMVWQGMRLVLTGLAIGLVAAAAGNRAIASLLYGAAGLNGAVFGGVTILFALVASVACLVPSWRAARIEPLVALRPD